MKFTKILMLLSVFTLFLVGCNNALNNNSTTSNPTPKDFLENDSADIFLLDGIVYSNTQDVVWVTELEYKLGKKIGEVTK